MTLICKPALALPEHCVTQHVLLEALRERYRNLPTLERMLHLIGHTTVEQRYFALPLEQIFEYEGIEKRVERYVSAGLSLALEAIEEALMQAALSAEAVDCLILTSCTCPGPVMPGLDSHIVNASRLPFNVRRLAIAQTGCHGGATALSLAHQYLLGQPDATVLVCAVELCSLNEQPADTALSSFVTRGLFGDGACAVVLKVQSSQQGFRILAASQYLVPETIEHMRYDNDELGNHFATHPHIVRGLKRGFPAIQTFLERHGYSAKDLGFLVCHTGGPRVMDAVVEELGLPEAGIALSRESLRAYGNLSSASVLDVLRRTFETNRPRDGMLGLLLGFGPGSTIEMLLGQWQEGEGA